MILSAERRQSFQSGQPALLGQGIRPCFGVAADFYHIWETR